MKRFITILSVAFSFVFALMGQDIRVKSQLDTNNIFIGDQIYMELSAIHPRDVAVRFPELKDTLSEEIEILEITKKDTIVLTEDRFEIRQKYLITAFDSGLHYIPPFAFTYQTQFLEDTVKTIPTYLHVASVPLDTTDIIKDIKSPVKEPLTWKEILPYAIGALLIIGLIIFLIYYLSNRKKPENGLVRRKIPSEPAHVFALRELDKLKTKKLWQKDKTKEYYIRLSEIMRIYLELRYQFDTLEFTTDEILQGLRKTSFNDNNLFERLENLLRTADLVKFAKATPLPDENETCMLDAYLFVNNTKLEEPPKTEDLEKMNKENTENEEEHTDNPTM